MKKIRVCRCEAVRIQLRYERIRDSRKVVNTAVKRREHSGATDDFGAFRLPESYSDARAELERSPSGVRPDQKTRKEHGTLRVRTDVGVP